MGCERGLMLVYNFFELWNMSFLLEIAVVLFHDSFSGVSFVCHGWDLDGLFWDLLYIVSSYFGKVSTISHEL
jgi:hypothetical protein